VLTPHLSADVRKGHGPSLFIWRATRRKEALPCTNGLSNAYVVTGYRVAHGTLAQICYSIENDGPVTINSRQRGTRRPMRLKASRPFGLISQAAELTRPLRGG